VLRRRLKLGLIVDCNNRGMELMRGGMEVSCSLKQNLQQSRTTPYLVIYKSGAGRRGRARSSAVRGGSSWTNHSGRPCAVCGDVGPQCDEVPLSALHRFDSIRQAVATLNEQVRRLDVHC